MARAKAESRRDDPLLARVAAALGERYVTAKPQALAPHLTEMRGRYRGAARFLATPGRTEEVAAVVRLCAEAGVPIVPHGGNTGLVGAGVPPEDGRAVVLSLARLDRIRELDALNYTITVEAGCILERVQQAAEEADRLFPVSLAAEGSCQIGGNLATNAGGTNVLRYGNMREQVLGLEVVLADGRVWNGLRRLRKDNTGYDLKQLFVGCEGTLGVITAAVLRLYPRPRETVTAFAAVRDVPAALELLSRCREASGECVTCFELLPRIGIELAVKHVAGAEDPLAGRHDWYVLLELAAGRPGGGLRDALEEVLMGAHEAGLVPDATLAASEAQAQAFWFLREAVVEAQRHEGGSIKHDIAVPVSAVPELLARATAAVEAMVPGARPVAFGHLGDGNIHFNVTQPEGADRAAFLARWEEVNRTVHDIVHGLDGSISAEHGVGRSKAAEVARLKPAVEIDMMRAVKRVLDPCDLMNPGKVLPPGQNDGV